MQISWCVYYLWLSVMFAKLYPPIKNLNPQTSFWNRTYFLGVSNVYCNSAYTIFVSHWGWTVYSYKFRKRRNKRKIIDHGKISRSRRDTQSYRKSCGGQFLGTSEVLKGWLLHLEYSLMLLYPYCSRKCLIIRELLATRNGTEYNASK